MARLAYAENTVDNMRKFLRKIRTTIKIRKRQLKFLGYDEEKRTGFLIQSQKWDGKSRKLF